MLTFELGDTSWLVTMKFQCIPLWRLGYDYSNIVMSATKINKNNNSQYIFHEQRIVDLVSAIWLFSTEPPN